MAGGTLSPAPALLYGWPRVPTTGTLPRVRNPSRRLPPRSPYTPRWPSSHRGGGGSQVPVGLYPGPLVPPGEGPRHVSAGGSGTIADPSEGRVAGLASFPLLNSCGARYCRVFTPDRLPALGHRPPGRQSLGPGVPRSPKPRDMRADTGPAWAPGTPNKRARHILGGESPPRTGRRPRCPVALGRIRLAILVSSGRIPPGLFLVHWKLRLIHRSATFRVHGSRDQDEDMPILRRRDQGRGDRVPILRARPPQGGRSACYVRST